MGTSEFNARGSSAMDKHPIKGTVEILQVTETGIFIMSSDPMAARPVRRIILPTQWRVISIR